MSAVVSFVEDAFEAVGDVFEAVGDVVEDVVEVVGDVVEKVGDVVQAVIDDPLPVLLSVAGSFVGIPPACHDGRNHCRTRW
jgi:phage-related protein